MERSIKTSRYGELDYRVYDAVQSSLRRIESLTKELKVLNIPLGFMIVPNGIEKEENYKLRSFYKDVSAKSLRECFSCEKDYTSIKDIAEEDNVSEPSEQELEYLHSH
jgi:hypothetical protein